MFPSKKKTLSFLRCWSLCKLVKSSEKAVELVVELTERQFQMPNSASYQFYIFYSDHLSSHSVVLFACSDTLVLSQYYKELGFQIPCLCHKWSQHPPGPSCRAFQPGLLADCARVLGNQSQLWLDHKLWALKHVFIAGRSRKCSFRTDVPHFLYNYRA